jgi:hypothetical protein
MQPFDRVQIGTRDPWSLRFPSEVVMRWLTACVAAIILDNVVYRTIM